MKRFTFLSLITVTLLVSGLITSPAGAATSNLIGSWVMGTTHDAEYGGDRVVVFIAHAESTSAINLSSVTYGGQEMTKAVDLSYNAASGYAYAAAFILDEAGIAAAGDSTFTPTWGGAMPGAMGYASAFFQNIDQNTPVGATDTGGATSNPVETSALATSSGDMVVMAATCGNTGSYTLNNDFIEGIDQAMGGTVEGVTGHKSATGADETPSAAFEGTINRQMIIGLVLNAAEGPGYPVYTISVSPASLDLAAAEGSTGAFDINSNTSWTVSSDQAWLTVSPASGSNDGTVTVTAEGNSGTTTRTAIVTVAGLGAASQTVTVSQVPILGLSQTWIYIAAAAGSTRTFDISTTTSWSVSSDQTWLTASPASGENDGTVTLTAQENPAPSIRTAMVTVYAIGASQTVTVMQSSGAGVYVVPPMPPFSALTDIPLFPDPFTFLDGRPVTTLDEWQCRRLEIAELIQEFESGYMPDTPYSATTGSMSGSSIVVDVNDNGTQISFSCSISYPSAGSPPYPALIGCGGSSLPSPSSLGVAVINFPNNSLAQQNSASSRGIGLFYNMYGSDHSASAMMAWAWGVDRLIDALEKTPQANIDTGRLAVTGCSRNGKGALMCGAFCDRIKLTIPQESGSGGSASWRVSEYSRDVLGYDVQWLCEICGENVWFRLNFDQFCDDVDKVPFDHHMLAGLCAPRALLFIENTSMDWLGNLSCWTNGRISHLIWEAMGVPDKMGFSQVGNHNHCAFPSSQQSILTAYFEKFLIGGGTADTSVMYTDGVGLPFDPNTWVDWVDWPVPSFPPDDNPPTPDPMTWLVPPAATGAHSIAMTATSAEDVTVVNYLFDCVTDSSKSSGWQGPQYEATDLQRDTEYSFRVKARDSDPIPHETDWSTTESATTAAGAVEVIGSWETGTTHAPEPGSSRGLIFFTHAENTTADAFGPISVTYGGQPMTKITDVNISQSSGGVSVGAFFLDEAGIAAAESNDFDVTWSTSLSRVGYGSVFIEGVHQLNPIGEYDFNSIISTGGIDTYPLSTDLGDMVIVAATCNQSYGAFSLNNGFVGAQAPSVTSASAINGYKGFKQSASGMETPSASHSWTWSASQKVLLGFVVNAEHPVLMTQHIMDTINALDESLFNNPNNKNALNNKLNAVISQLEVKNYHGAINKLQHDLLGKTDGCAEIGEPDSNDWILDCDAQAEVYPLIVELIDFLMNM